MRSWKYGEQYKNIEGKEITPTPTGQNIEMVPFIKSFRENNMLQANKWKDTLALGGGESPVNQNHESIWNWMSLWKHMWVIKC